MYICGVNNFGTIYLFESSCSSIDINTKLCNLPWLEDNSKFIKTNRLNLIKSTQGHMKLALPKNLDFKHYSSIWDTEIQIGSVENHSSRLFAFQDHNLNNVIVKMINNLENIIENF